MLCLGLQANHAKMSTAGAGCCRVLDKSRSPTRGGALPNIMNTCTTAPAPACEVSIAVVRYGDFGDCLALAATVDGLAPGKRCELLSVSYRGRSVAWVTLPTGAPRAAVEAAVLSRASWFLGSRCPDMATYPLTFN
jgi:hypothetical protein